MVSSPSQLLNDHKVEMASANEEIKAARKEIQAVLLQRVKGSKILERLMRHQRRGKLIGYDAPILFEAFSLEGYQVDVVHHDGTCRNEDCTDDVIIVDRWPIASILAFKSSPKKPSVQRPVVNKKPSHQPQKHAAR